VTPRDLLLALLVVFLWGLNFVVIKWGVDLMPPLLLTALRYTFAALPAVFFIRPPKVRFGILATYGVAVGVLQFGSLFMAIKLGMPAGLSSVVIQMQVFFTMGLAALFLGERPGWPQLVGAGIALLGMIAIGLERLGGAALLPFLLTLAAALGWGIANIATKKAGKIDMLAFVVWASLIPPIPLMVLSLLIEGPAADWAALSHFSWLLAGVVAFNSFGATLVGFGLWSVLLTRYPAGVVAPFALLVPVFGIASSALLLHEPLSSLEIIGSVLIFLGLGVNVFGARILAARLRPA